MTAPTDSAALSALEALRRYASSPAHDEALMRRMLGEGIRELAAEDAALVDGYLLAAEDVVGTSKSKVQRILAAVKAARKSAPTDRADDYYEPSGITLAAAVRSAGGPAIEGLDLPVGYELGAGLEVYQLVRTRDAVERRLVAPGLICVTDRAVSPTGQVWLGLGWRGPLGWVRHLVPRGTIARREQVSALADLGAPVDGSTLTPVQRWLAAQEACSAIPTRTACESMGWVDPRQPSRGFVLGSDIVGNTAPGDGAEMVGSGTGQALVAAGYSVAGSWESWRTDVWDRVATHPIATIVLLVATVAPVLRLIPEANPFILDLGFSSGTGKSVVTSVASSVWGDPDVTLGRWDGTSRGIEERGRWQGDVPFFMDDSKAVANEDAGRRKIVDLVHAYTDAGGRSRMGQDGRLETLGSIRGILVTMGELSVARMAQNSQGAITRLLTIEEPPWKISGPEGARLVESLRVASSTHYGHAGRRLVEWLARRPEGELRRIRQYYLTALERLRSEHASASGPSQRMMAHVALLDTAANCASQAWGVPRPTEAVRAALMCVLRAGSLANVADRAYDGLVSHIAMNSGRMAGRDAEVPAGVSIIGRWRSTDRHPYIVKTEAEAAVARLGYDAKNVIEQMVRAGLLVPRQARLTRGAGSTPVPCYRVMLRQGDGNVDD